MPSGPPPRISKYVWDGLNYRTRAGGKVVPDRLIDQEFSAMQIRSSKRMAAVAREYSAKKINLAQFEISMRDEIKRIHTQSLALARGGWANVTVKDWGRLGSSTRFQYERLNLLSLRLADQSIDPASPAFVRRVQSYALASRRSFSEGRVQNMKDFIGEGVQILARRRLGPVATEHCSDCATWAGKKWMPVERIPPIGVLMCGSFCHCSIEFDARQLREAIARMDALESSVTNSSKAAPLKVSGLEQRERDLLARLADSGDSPLAFSDLSRIEQRTAARLNQQGRIRSEKIKGRRVFYFDRQD